VYSAGTSISLPSMMILLMRLSPRTRPANRRADR
jgi:hypothetical protein